MGSGKGLLQQKVRQSFDVVWTLAKGRNAQLELIEAVVKIAAEAALVDGLFEVRVGGGDDPHIHLHFAAPAQAVIRHAIENPQQLNLYFGVEFADFVEE